MNLKKKYFLFLIASMVFYAEALWVRFKYFNPVSAWLKPVNAYTEYDEINFVINSVYFSGFLIVATLFFVSYFILTKDEIK